MINLEDKIFESVKVGDKKAIEDALLVVSGLKEDEISLYKEKLDKIESEFDIYLRKHGKTVDLKRKAAQLYYFIDERKALSYKKDTYLLTRAIDGFFGSTQTRIGNCLAMSQLYAVLGIRRGLELSCEATHDHIWLNLEYKKEYAPIDMAAGLEPASSIQKIRARGSRGIKLPLNYIVSSALSNLAIDTEDCIEEIKIVKKAIDICSKNPFLFIHLAFAKKDAGDLSGALKDCDKAIALGHEYSYLYRSRANMQSQSKNYPAALYDYEKAINLDKYDEDNYYWRGKTYYEMNNLNTAAADFSRAGLILVNKYGKHEEIDKKSEILAYSGACLAQLGKTESALAHLDAALLLNSENEFAREWRERISIK